MKMSSPADRPQPISAPAAGADDSTGLLTAADGRRLALQPGKFLAHLTAELSHVFGEDTPATAYKLGYEWALREMTVLDRQNSAAAGGNPAANLWSLPRAKVLDRWWTPLRAAGWGSCSFNLPADAGNVTLVTLRHSLAAAHISGATAPACHLCSGLFAGALSFLEVSEYHAIEYQCTALGAPDCRFAVAPVERIEQVLASLREGLEPAALRARLA